MYFLIFEILFMYFLCCEEIKIEQTENILRSKSNNGKIFINNFALMIEESQQKNCSSQKKTIPTHEVMQSFSSSVVLCYLILTNFPVYLPKTF